MHPRKTLLVLNSIQLFIFLILTAFIFTLPSNQDTVSSLFDNQDLFYKFVFKGGVGFVSSEYVTLGSIFFVSTLVSLISLLIIHGNFRKLYIIPLIYYFLIVVFFPIGTVLGILSLYSLYVLHEDYSHKPKLNRQDIVTDLENSANEVERTKEVEESFIQTKPKLSSKPLLENNPT